ncbi:MAG: ATP-binding cassette domain-containing protein [Deltaproteobacteria bacterium]|nr:ATP-binding cassette domain-containing protein [Deltaproteobacteria bacterium]
MTIRGMVVNAEQQSVLVAARDLHKSYGENHVLRGVTFDALRGRINVIIGGSGAGKTVLMRHLLVLERPDSGAVLLDGEDITTLGDLKLNAVRLRFGMVFQGSALFDSMSVFDNVAFPLRERGGLSRREIRDRAMDKLTVLGVADAAERFPGDISGGMKKRVGVARAVVTEPEILIYDEPTAGLDPLAARNVDRLILTTAEKFGVTSLVITHDMATCLGVGDRVSLLHAGRIRTTCLPRELFGSDDPVVREFVAASGVAP